MDEHITKEHLAALSRSAMAFSGMSPEGDLYREIAVQVKALLGNAIVATCSFDEPTATIEQRALVGLPKLLSAPLSHPRFQASPMRTIANPEAIEQMASGRLVKIEEGIYELCLRKIPRSVTRSMERLGGITGTYGMGCVAEGVCFGGVSFCLRGNAILPPQDVLEALIFQAAMALKRWQAESDLRKSEARYRLLMDRAADPYAVADRDARFLEVNEATCIALGFTREELLGRTAIDVLDPAELADRPFPWKQVLDHENFVQTRRLKRKDGSYVMFEVHVAPLPDEQVMFCGRDITERREVERAAIEAGEDERRTVGRDLHDSVGQELAAMGYLSAALGRRLESQQNPDAELATRIAGLARDAVEQIRRIAQGLCPVDMSEEGISVALDELAAQLRSLGLTQCTVTMAGPTGDIPPETAMHLYQITQEASNNAMRHGKADKIAIELNVRDGRGELTIRDNGSGIASGAENGSGLGLRTMRYRADLIDGVFDVETGSTETTVTCSFPHSKS
jgi:PAS domain S-box-containing protein